MYFVSFLLCFVECVAHICLLAGLGEGNGEDLSSQCLTSGSVDEWVCAAYSMDLNEMEWTIGRSGVNIEM